MTTRKRTSKFLEKSKKSLLVIPMLTSLFSHGQNLVKNGDFEELSPYGTNLVVGNNVWMSVSNPVAPSSPHTVYAESVQLIDVWNPYHSGGTQGIDLHIDVSHPSWGGNYQYDPWNHIGGVGPIFYPAYQIPGKMGTHQTSGPAMLEDGNLSNGFSAYPHMEAGLSQGAEVSPNLNEFLQGCFTEKLDLFKKYTMSFKYSIPCDQAASAGGGDDKITINLFDKELIDAQSPNSYGGGYLAGSTGPMMDINSSTFNWDLYTNGTPYHTELPGSHRLELHEEIIPAGTAPCEWQTVTFEFCIADLMSDPNNNTILANPQYVNLPLSYMHNGHMLDADFYDANQAGWPYSYTQNTTVASFINNYIVPSGYKLFNFKEVFGVTVKGGEDVYIDDFSVEEVDCTLDTDFTVTQTCSLVDGQPMVTFQLTPNGPAYNPYIFKARNVTNNGAWMQIYNSTVPLGGVHTFTVPYVAGEQYSFSNGTWSQSSGGCGWTSESKTVTVDPQGNWFATTPDFTLQGLSYSGFPASWFGLHAVSGTAGLTSTWEYQVEYDNSTVSAWMPVSTSANTTGNGNTDFIIWFDCNDAYFPFLEPDATHSNVKVVNVKRTNFGSCEAEGVSQIRSFVNCLQSGEAESPKYRGSSNEVVSISKDELEGMIGMEIPEDVLMVFPNPANEAVNVQFDRSEKRTISLTTLSGKEVMSSLETEERSLQIPLANLASGVYLLKVSTASGVQIKRIVKK